MASEEAAQTATAMETDQPEVKAAPMADTEAPMAEANGAHEAAAASTEEKKEEEEKEDYVMVSKDDVKDMEEKKEEEKEEEEGEEEEEDDEDDEDDVPDPSKTLLGAPLIQSGTRQRKQVQRLNDEIEGPKERKPVEIPKGKGTQLGEMNHVKSQLEKLKPAELKDVHRLLFGTPGTVMQVKKHIRQFCGFVFANDDERKRKEEQLHKRTTDQLKFLCDLFNVHKADKQVMVERLMEWLEEPQPGEDDDVVKPKAKLGGSVKRKASAKTSKKSGKGTPKKASGKASKKSSGKSDKGPKRPLSAFMFFQQDKRPKILEENPGIAFGDVGKKLGVMWAAVSASEKKKYEEKSAADKERYERELKSGVTSKGTPKKATPKKSAAPKKKAASSTKKAKKAESEEESESESDDEPISKKAKSGPSDAEIKKAIKDIVVKVGEDVTFNKVKEGLLTRFPTLDVAERKAELKDWARAIIEESA